MYLKAAIEDKDGIQTVAYLTDLETMKQANAKRMDVVTDIHSSRKFVKFILDEEVYLVPV